MVAPIAAGAGVSALVLFPSSMGLFALMSISEGLGGGESRLTYISMIS
jgi:hypothetical protein